MILKMEDLLPQQNPPDSADRLRIVEAIAQGGAGVLLDTNPVFASVGTRLIESTGDVARVGFTLPESMSRGEDIAAGGAVTTCLDTAMVVAVFAKLQPGQSCTSINFTVNMLRPAKIGELVAEGVVEKVGRSVCFASAKLYGADGKLVATASSAVAVVTLR